MFHGHRVWFCALMIPISRTGFPRPPSRQYVARHSSPKQNGLVRLIASRCFLCDCPTGRSPSPTDSQILRVLSAPPREATFLWARKGLVCFFTRGGRCAKGAAWCCPEGDSGVGMRVWVSPGSRTPPCRGAREAGLDRGTGTARQAPQKFVQSGQAPEPAALQRHHTSQGEHFPQRPLNRARAGPPGGPRGLGLTLPPSRHPDGGRRLLLRERPGSSVSGAATPEF